MMTQFSPSAMRGPQQGAAPHLTGFGFPTYLSKHVHILLGWLMQDCPAPQGLEARNQTTAAGPEQKVAAGIRPSDACQQRLNRVQRGLERASALYLLK